MNKSNRKSLRLGSYTMVISAVALVILIVVNLLVAALPSTVTQIDTTSTKINSIGEETKEILASVNSEINIYMLVEKDNEASVTTIDTLIKRYAEESSFINYSVMDPALYPNFATQYTNDSLTSGSVIVVSDSRNYVIDGSEWYMYETDYGNFDAETYSYYAQMGYLDGTDPYMFYGESNLTTAVYYVTAADIPTMYTLSGHGESTLSATFSEYLKKDSIETESLALLTGDMTVPEDCDVLFIYNPQMDIAETEKTAISDYYKGGGNVILLTSPLYFSAEKTPNLCALANEMGIVSTDGVVIEENRNYYMQYPLYLVPRLGSGGPVSLMSTDNLTFFTPNAHGLSQAEDSETSYYSLLSTSDSAFIKTDIENFDTYAKEDGDIDGGFDIGAATVLKGEGATARFAWFSTSEIANEQCDYGGNSALFTSTVDWMCEKTVNMSVVGTEMESSVLTATSADVNIWNTVLMGILPLSFLGFGFYVWFRRRRR